MRNRTILLAMLLAVLLLPVACPAEDNDWSVEEVTFPGVTLEGRTLVVPEGVTEMGWSWDYEADSDDLSEILCIEGSFLTGPDDEGEWLPIYDTVRLPSTLKRLDQESLIYMEITGDLVIPEGLEEMGDYCLYGTSATGRLMLPSTLRSEPYFEDCSFVEVVISPDNPWYCTVEGVVFTRDMTELVWYPHWLTAAHYDVPTGVRIIRDGAFNGNDHLQTVSLPLGLTTIRAYAFSACGRLTSVNMPLTVTELGECAFRDCVSLQRVTVPPAIAALLDDMPELEEKYRSPSYVSQSTQEELEALERLPLWVFDNCPALGTFYGDNGRDMIE